MAESPQEKEALEKLDEETREVAWDEFDKETDREANTWRMSGSWLRRFGRFRRFHYVKGDPEPEPVDDEDPGDEHGLRDAFREGNEKS